jgi:GTPase KRas protein
LFVDEYDPTIEDSYQKQLTRNGKTYQLDLLDTAGQEEYSAMRDIYMAEGESFIICYACNSHDSFDSVIDFAEMISRVRDDEIENIPIVLVATKADLPRDEHEVTESEGRQLASRLNCDFVSTSAFTGQNINRVFEGVVEAVLKARARQREIDEALISGNKKPGRKRVFKSCKML